VPFAEINHWSVQQGWIQAVIDAGLLKPSDYGSNFNPDWPITRQEVLLAAVRATGGEGLALSLPGAPLTGNDSEAIPPWIQGWVAVGLKEDLIRGQSDGKLHLPEPASRAEATTMVERAVNAVTPAISAFEGKTSQAGLRYPAPGEPVWELGPRPSLSPTVTGGSYLYQLPGFADGLTLTPAPGGGAWVGYVVEGTDVPVQAFAWARDGKLTEVRRQSMLGPFERPLAVDGTGRLTIAVGDAVKRVSKEGIIETLADNQPLQQAVYTPDGTLWGATGARGEIVRWDQKLGWVKIALPVTAEAKIQSLLPSPSGGIWVLVYDAKAHETWAIEVSKTQVKRNLLLIPSHLHGVDPLPVRPVIQGTDELWLVRENRAGEGATVQTGYFRFDLREGRLLPLVAPPQLKGPFVLRPSVSGGALLGDGSGLFWQLLPIESAK
jgi:hypothetical protein